MLNSSMLRKALLSVLLGAFVASCAYNATGALPRRTLIFEASVEGQNLTQSNNLAYYFVLNTAGALASPAPGTDPNLGGNAERAPLVNGPAPLSFPYPDPRSYLPFVRDEAAILDREPVSVPNTYWTEYFWLSEEAGTFTMWQARRNEDGTINERYRQLQNGREWGIKDGRTIQLTLPFNQLTNLDTDTPPDQIMANLAVATRALDNNQRGFVIERWGRVQNTFFPILTRTGNQNLYDTVSGVTFPQNLGPVDPRSVNFVSISYRVVFAD